MDFKGRVRRVWSIHCPQEVFLKVNSGLLLGKSLRWGYERRAIKTLYYCWYYFMFPVQASFVWRYIPSWIWTWTWTLRLFVVAESDCVVVYYFVGVLSFIFFVLLSYGTFFFFKKKLGNKYVDIYWMRIFVVFSDFGNQLCSLFGWCEDYVFCGEVLFSYVRPILHCVFLLKPKVLNSKPLVTQKVSSTIRHPSFYGVIHVMSRLNLGVN